MDQKELTEKNINDAVHDARSSLSVIRLNCEMLLMDEKIDPEAVEILKNNIKEIDKVSEILGSLTA